MLLEYEDYKIGNTPIIKLSENIYLKDETKNPNGSIKDRAAFYMTKFVTTTMPKVNRIVESTSGNLGKSLAFFAKEAGLDLTCVMDDAASKLKTEEIHNINMGVELYIVKADDKTDPREQRIILAKELALLDTTIFLNQYDNENNFLANFETTGLEIVNYTEVNFDFLICSVGTGGTITGIAKKIKDMNKPTKVVGVEPEGSTIHGGVYKKYISAGAGLSKQSLLIKKYGHFVDQWELVADELAIAKCSALYAKGVSVGITTGMCLVVAQKIVAQNSEAKCLVIQADGFENYTEFI